MFNSNKLEWTWSSSSCNNTFLPIKMHQHVPLPWNLTWNLKMMVSKRESPIPGVSFSGSFWLNFGGSMFFVRKICTHRTIHRRITGSFQALPGSEGVGSAASGGGEIFQRWWPLEHDHKMDEKNLKDVISSDSRLMILYFLQVVRHLKFNYFYGNIYGELKEND